MKKILPYIFLLIIVGCNTVTSKDMTNYKPEIATNLTKTLLFRSDNPDDDILGPDPDVNKCICKGTGVITHGDGHTSPCPYHGRGINEEDPIEEEEEPVVTDSTPDIDIDIIETQEPIVDGNPIIYTQQQQQQTYYYYERPRVFPILSRWWR